MPTTVKLQNVRLAFFNGFEPRAFEEGQEKKYDATFLIPKTDTKQIGEINKAIRNEAVSKWGAKAEGVLKSIESNPLKYCFLDGETKDLDGFGGHFSLSSKSTVRPLVIDRDRTPLTKEDGKPYPGCYVNASVEIWPQDHPKHGKGIRAQLKGVQFSKDGDAFAGGRPANVDDFDDLADPAGEELA